MKLLFRLFSCVIAAFTCLAAWPQSVITWTGGNGDWNNPANWSAGQIPVATNDVIIDRPVAVTIVHSSGDHMVRSIQSKADIILSGGSLTVTEGMSSFDGAFSMSGGAMLKALGASASISAANAGNLDTGWLSAEQGGQIILPNLKRYRSGSGCGNVFWRASEGGIIHLPAITNLTGGDCGTLLIQATTGGQVDLSSVGLSSGLISVLASGTQSLVDLSVLSNAGTAASSSLTLEAKSGGSIHVPSLADGSAVKLILSLGGDIPTAQFTSLGDVTLSGVALSLPAVTNLDNGNIALDAGAQLTLEAPARYKKETGCANTYWRVSAESTLNLPNLTNITGGNCGTLIMEATAGGRMNFPQLAVSGGLISMTADGFDSLIDLTNLIVAGSPDTSRLSLTAKNFGAVHVPRLQNGEAVNVALSPNGEITTVQFTQLRDILLDAVSLSLPALTNLDTGSITLNSGAALSLPGVEEYSNRSGCANTYWRIGGGSVLDLPGLANLVGANCGYLALEASGGSQILTTNLLASSGNISLLAGGVGSIIDTRRFANAGSPDDSTLALEATSGGSILISQLADAASVKLTLRPGGAIPTGQLRQLKSITLDGVILELPAVTNIDNADISVMAGGALTLPGLVAFHGPLGCANTVWRIEGGSRLQFPQLATVAGGNCGTLQIQAVGGSLASFPILGSTTGLISLLADGTGSKITITNHSNVIWQKDLTNEERNGGAIERNFSIVALRVMRNADTVTIIWPTSPLNWRIQSAATVETPITWTPVNAQTQTVGNEVSATIPNPANFQFFRLVNP